MSSKTISVAANMGAGWAINADIRDHKVVIDQPQAGGGTNEGPTPLEFFLFSIAGCIGTIGRIAASQKRIELRGMEIKVDADLNPMGLMGKATDDRVGFTQIRIAAQIDADLTDEEKKVFLDEVCDRCPLHDNVKLSTEVVHDLV